MFLCVSIDSVVKLFCLCYCFVKGNAVLLKIEFLAVDLPSSSINVLVIACVALYPLSRLVMCKSSKSVGFRSVPNPPFLRPYQPVVAVTCMFGFYFDTDTGWCADGLPCSVRFIASIGLILTPTSFDLRSS